MMIREVLLEVFGYLTLTPHKVHRRKPGIIIFDQNYVLFSSH